MAKHLLRHGYRVIGCDVDQKQREAARLAGAETVDSPADLGKAAQFVIVAVGYDEEVAQVMLGNGGLLQNPGAGGPVSGSSTCAPGTGKTLAARGAQRTIGGGEATRL